jgi:pyrroloquinoline quinone (PQQ) biosynthesis protein C
MTNYERLLKETEQARNELLSIPAIARGAQGEISLDSYIAFLTEAYHHVKHTVPLLMACGSRVPESHEWLREAMGHYIEEEMGHQEWILNDIAACGADKEAVRNGIPDVATELMVAYAYDTVYRNNPVGFLGMVLVLEGTSIKLATGAAGAIKDSLQLPQQAFSYLTSHGELDISHMDFYQSLVDRLQGEEDLQAVIHCANVFYKLYGDIFRALPLDDVNNLLQANG